MAYVRPTKGKDGRYNYVSYGGLGRRIVDPTPEEIRQRCLEVQASWTPEEERERRLGYVQECDSDGNPITIQAIPIYSSSDIVPHFFEDRIFEEHDNDI